MSNLHLFTAAASVAAHIGALALLPAAGPTPDRPRAEAFEMVEIPVEAPEPAEPPPAREEEPTPEPPTPVPAAPRPLDAPPSSPPPAEAEAGRVLASADEAGPEVADFTMVQGDGGGYAGGTTSRRGTSREPSLRAGARPRGTPSGRGSGRAAEWDRSRMARPASGAWNCARLFPAAADAADVHHALVTVVVEVSAAGQPARVSVVRDPGHGFGAAARACALGQRYVAALDPRGRAIRGSTAPFSVRFMR
ncbi:MAG: hypothetical protein AAGN82_20115 [Myxococcota bacterium]